MEALLTKIFNWLKWFFENLLEYPKEFFFWLLSKIFPLFESLFYFAIDALFTLAEYAIGLIDFKADLFDTAAEWANLPPAAIYIMNQSGLATCVTMLMAAIGIRIAMNLLPVPMIRI